ncbi:nickel pincer cofactor biosynthesis protein LarB [Spirulina major CS-329]|uniref:nickel pincer cofactor biosynthesis protein LarB n=1 Tax=Spirulina TaxID=1154 RepID=UPI00232BFCF2|nr:MULTISPECIES: nickel pincer cofactor biosynthesis protein LarB [Spirulina]MDB9493696.1 nickel pincer cofactor biosynthesis protein LarB [Spirulina subsalsa CS-330]MDB9504884.1 nickel pincer cofactor biosynthesis protein LarB [Spirulina major CS-329]
MGQRDSLQSILEAVSAGYLSPQVAAAKLGQAETGYEAISDFAKLDHHRQARTGFPEAIWGQDKTPDQIVQIFQAMQHHPAIAMATRITPAVFAQLQRQLPGLRYYETARICALGTPKTHRPGTITLLTAGTADLPVAEEAAVTAELMGFTVERLWDVGVAGIQRLLRHQDAIATADVLIVVAGMEGALPSVVGGLADCPVIAVPTSIGYGASFGGLTPLLGMLNSCAAGIGVVNIDNGFGAAILAGQILRTAEKFAQSRPSRPESPPNS